MLTTLARGLMFRRLLPATLVAASFVLAAPHAAAQEQTPTPTPMASPTPAPAASPTPASEPLYREYRGVSLGMSAEEARRALGEPKSKGTRQDFYVLSEKETAQVFYRDGKVSALAVSYVGESSGAPSALEVLGVEVTPKKDGSLHRRIRYRKAGYWVSYSRSAGRNPITTVTMRRS